MSEKKISYYDSKGYNGSTYIELFVHYIKDEHKKLYGSELSLEDWVVDKNPGDCPSQGSNNNACGVMVCAICDLILHGHPPSLFKLEDELCSDGGLLYL